MSRRASLVATLGLSIACAGCATPPPVVAPGLALRKVVIYRNGVGYFERGGRVNSDRVQFKVRKDEVGDFLATLAVLERGGSSVRSASFPLDVEDDDAPAPPPAPPRPMPALYTLAPASSVPAPVAGSVAQPPRDVNRVIMALDGKEHDLQVGYIARTPVWRPSYRLVIDKDGANLQTWGIVQNLSGEDWTNVSLSLVAEAPLAFDASLATAVIPPRPTVSDGGDVIAVIPRSETSLAQGPPPPAAAAPAPESMDRMEEAEKSMAAPGRSRAARPSAAPSKKAKGGMAAELFSRDDAGSMVGGGGYGGVAAPDYSQRTKNLAALAAIGVQAGTTRYDLPAAVTIPDKSATMVMLLDQHVPGEVVALFAPDGGVPGSLSHPFRVARFSNKTGGLLERGPLAIFSEGAFVGQGMTDPLPDGADRVAKLVIKHPRTAGARMNNFPAGTEDNTGTGSALVPAPVGARATVDLTLDERQQTTRGVDWLEPLADDAVKAYLGDRRADQVVAAQLKAAWEIRKVLVAANQERHKLMAEDGERRRVTEETRANILALAKNTAAGDLRAKLTERLAGDSAKLDVVGKKLIEVNMRIAENQVRFAEAIRAIKVMQPLAME